MKFSWHLHSSAPDLPLAFKQFQEHLDNKVLDREPDLNIRVVWKVGKDNIIITELEFLVFTSLIAVSVVLVMKCHNSAK